MPNGSVADTARPGPDIRQAEVRRRWSGTDDSPPVEALRRIDEGEPSRRSRVRDSAGDLNGFSLRGRRVGVLVLDDGVGSGVA